MLDRLQAKINRRRSGSPSTQRGPPTPPYEAQNSLSSPESTGVNRIPTLLEGPTTERSPSYSSTMPRMTRTASNMSTTTTTTLPAYSAIGGTTSSPPKYTPRTTNSDILFHNITPSSIYPTTRTTSSSSSPSTLLSSIGLTWSPLSMSPDDFMRKYQSQSQRPRTKKLIPLDHPVHDMSGAEQASFRRRGLDPVVVAEMRVLSRQGRGGCGVDGGRRRVRPGSGLATGAGAGPGRGRQVMPLSVAVPVSAS